MKIEQTCGHCPHLDSTSFGGLRIFHCGLTESVVPQQSKSGETVFTRVLESCPRPEAEVRKSDTPAPKKEWVRVQEKAELV